MLKSKVSVSRKSLRLLGKLLGLLLTSFANTHCRVSGSHEGGRVTVAGDGQAQSLVSRESGGKGTELLDSFLGFHS